MEEIALNWSGPYSFAVTIGGEVNLDWRVSLATTPATWLLNALSGMLPKALWHNAPFLKVMGGAAGLFRIKPGSATFGFHSVGFLLSERQCLSLTTQLITAC